MVIAQNTHAAMKRVILLRPIETAQSGVTLFRDVLKDGAARNWGRWASARRSWTEAAEAYHAAMDLTDRLFRTQLFRSHKEAWLREAKALPAHAAYALARSGDASGAVQALERGRALLLSESLQRDRANLDHLMDLGHQDLAESYRQAADRVHDLSRATRRPGPLDTDPVPSPDRNRS